EHCSVEGRDAASWGDELESLRFDFEGADLGQEVQRRREAVQAQLHDISKRERLLERRERELDLLRERVARHGLQRISSPAVRQCKRCSSWRDAWRRSTRPFSSMVKRYRQGI